MAQQQPSTNNTGVETIVNQINETLQQLPKVVSAKSKVVKQDLTRKYQVQFLGGQAQEYVLGYN
ncbi:hypothetical protein [Thalassotalea euphylliae]|uniref:Uncharacterized protein n=1 Tax=Thalassotalea euphylliae TaxID=1655234 RepID=A0A3E0UFE7_9GAMM|nr:hypothetical protein [Thalassotalea euphylliae]REL29659.1 hypothetical protein DXX94_02415 [Thalassotalea euphylliae]REL35718.1 hypothetical protein DXX92_10405 [Thalassotalea euphylliae]